MEKIGKYEIITTIGVGGFGVVYEGRDPFIKRRVAIKTCGSEQGEIRERFFREAEIAGNLHHRNITTVHDFGIQDGVPYLVQEFLSGEDLKKKIARRDPIPDEQKLDYLLQTGRGLEHAHSRGVIHRDIKPGNVRVLEDGTVKIMDFGIAKLVHMESNLTRTGITLGTAAYLAPEQIRGSGVDHRADIFSFGVLAYELLSYCRPFPGKTISALFFQILQADPEPLAAHWDGCPDSLERLLRRCLAKEPGARYQNLREILEELHDAQARAGTTARLSTHPTAVLSREEMLSSAPAAGSEEEGTCRDLAEEAEGALVGGDLTAARRSLEKARGAYGEKPLFEELFPPLLERVEKAEEQERRRAEIDRLRRRSFLKAAKLLQSRRFDQASAQLNRYLKDYPEDRRAWSMLQQAEAGLGGTGAGAGDATGRRPTTEPVAHGQSRDRLGPDEDAKLLEVLLAEEDRRIEDGLGESDEDDISAAYLTIESLLDSDHPAAAKRRLREAEKRHGETPFLPLRGQLARLERRLLDQELDRDVESARQLLSERRMAEAVEVLARVLDVDPLQVGAQQVLEEAKEAIAESLASAPEEEAVSETAHRAGSPLAHDDVPASAAGVEDAGGGAQPVAPLLPEVPGVSSGSARPDNRILFVLLFAALAVLAAALALWLVG
jgi:tetratricopeptide (TPR) repeat protein